MKLKSMMLATMLAGSVFGNVYAGTIDGVTTPDILLVANDPAQPNFYSGEFGRTPLTAGAFTDVYTFLPSLTDGSLASGTLSNIRLGSSGNLNITSVMLNDVSYTKLSSSYWELTDAVLGAGPLTLTVIGTLSQGGSYAGTLNVLLAPVPEAETYAMMVGGLGLLGFMARRRKKQG